MMEIAKGLPRLFKEHYQHGANVFLVVPGHSHRGGVTFGVAVAHLDPEDGEPFCGCPAFAPPHPS